MMDSIFGTTNFKNHITWKRTSAHNDPNKYGRISDIILFYCKSTKYKYNIIYTDYSEATKKLYKHEDNYGNYTASDLTGHGVSNGESGNEWEWDLTPRM